MLLFFGLNDLSLKSSTIFITTFHQKTLIKRTDILEKPSNTPIRYPLLFLHIFIILVIQSTLNLRPNFLCFFHFFWKIF